jgi:hypothetical protein
MKEFSYKGYRFPPEIIQQAIWLYLRFTLSLRDVEDLLAERGIAVSYEAIRRRVNYFGPKIAMDLRTRRPKPHTVWHLDEMLKLWLCPRKDELRSYAAAASDLGIAKHHERVDGVTTEPRIRISRPDDERARCKVSRAPGPRKDFSQSTQPPTTSSTSNAISPQQERTELSGHRPCKRGVKLSSRRNPTCQQACYELNLSI